MQCLKIPSLLSIPGLTKKSLKRTSFYSMPIISCIQNKNSSLKVSFIPILQAVVWVGNIWFEAFFCLFVRFNNRSIITSQSQWTCYARKTNSFHVSQQFNLTVSTASLLFWLTKLHSISGQQDLGLY